MYDKSEYTRRVTQDFEQTIAALGEGSVRSIQDLAEATFDAIDRSRKRQRHKCCNALFLGLRDVHATHTIERIKDGQCGVHAKSKCGACILGGINELTQYLRSAAAECAGPKVTVYCSEFYRRRQEDEAELFVASRVIGDDEDEIEVDDIVCTNVACPTNDPGKQVRRRVQKKNVQIRSSDEPDTQYLFCRVCKHRWTVRD